MMEEKPKKVGKVGYFNGLTGYIIYKDDMIPFHKKDCLCLNDNEELVDKEVEFDLEINDYGKIARNVELKKVLKKNNKDKI